MKKLFVWLVLVPSLSLCINTIALGDPSTNSKQVQSVPPAVSVVVETIKENRDKKKIGTDTYFLKNLIKLKLMLNSYFKLNPDEKENFTNVLSHAYPST